EQAALTTRRILDAARKGFGDAGYEATTLRAIAAEAGVAVQTVYAVFGSKANILRALRESLVTDPAASEAYGAALAATEVDEALAAFAHSIRLRWEAGHDIVMINASAAAADPEIRAEVAAANAMRSGGIARLAQRLGALEPGLDPPRVEALLDALTLTSLYERLVATHSWSADDYESWLAGALRRDIRDSTQALDQEIPR
ncbi:MAG: helix-turn-helix domain-containing protein, partial [Chloroflexota bacterium]